MSSPDLPPASGGTPPALVQGSDHCRLGEPLVESAARLADAVAASLTHNPVVTVSLKGIRGLSSSFANVLFLRVAEAYGHAALRSRIRFETDSKAQVEVLERSLEAVLASPSS